MSQDDYKKLYEAALQKARQLAKEVRKLRHVIEGDVCRKCKDSKRCCWHTEE